MKSCYQSKELFFPIKIIIVIIFYVRYSSRKEEIIQETIKTKMVEIIQLKCTIFESVCNNRSSKAFELAAAYLQIRKGQ